VVEGGGLESRCTGNRTVGSNPTLSAREPQNADFSGLSKDFYQEFDNYFKNNQDYLTKLKETYYIVLKINGKVVKKSLRTSNLYIANYFKLLILYKLQNYIRITKMPTKKMIAMGSIFGKFPSNRAARHINKILKEYKELLDNNEFDKVRENLKNSNIDNNLLNLILEKIDKIEQKVFEEDKKYPQYTLKQCFDDFITLKKQEKVTEQTLQKYKKVYNTLTNFIKEDTDLNTLTDADFRDYYDYIVKSNFANKTKAYYVNYVKLMFEYAFNSHKIKNKLMERYKLSENKKQQQTYLSFSENDLKKLFRYYKDDRNITEIMLILLHTGMRVGELANLEINDVNLKNKTMMIASKGGKTKNAKRLIYIHPDIFDIIKKLKKQSRDNYIIYLGENIKDRADTLSKKMNRAIKKVIREKNKVVHSFRKNFTQKLYEVSTAEHIIKYILGHSQSDNLTFNVYNLNKVNMKQIKEIISKIKYPCINPS